MYRSIQMITINMSKLNIYYFYIYLHKWRERQREREERRNVIFIINYIYFPPILGTGDIRTPLSQSSAIFSAILGNSISLPWASGKQKLIKLKRHVMNEIKYADVSFGMFWQQVPGSINCECVDKLLHFSVT